MPSTNKTETIGLSQYQGNEYQKRIDVNEDNLKIDNKFKSVDEQMSESMNILIPISGSTANAILLGVAAFKNNQRYSFKANATSTGNVTINGKAFKKNDGTQIGSGGVKVNKVYDFYYDSSADCVFILAKAEGDSTVADVLAGKIFSNGDDTGLIGTMPNNGTVNQSLAINGTYTIPKGYHNGTGKVTQSVTTKAAATITPGTANQTIPANIYTTGVQTILGDPDLLAANIVSGKNIFGVVGVATIASLGGKRFATGSATTNSSSQFTVSGLSFTPSLVIGLITTYDAICLLSKASTGLRTTDYNIRCSHSSGASTPSAGMGITTNGFVAEFTNYTNRSANWIAFE